MSAQHPVVIPAKRCVGIARAGTHGESVSVGPGSRAIALARDDSSVLGREAMSALLLPSPWPATEPAIQQARLRADESLALADASALGGRRKPGHGEDAA